MIYFFHHYELPVIVQQAQLQQMFMRSVRNNNNNNRQADNGQAAAAAAGGGNQQMNRENQQVPIEAPIAAAAPERPTNNANNMFVVRGTYRRRVNHLVERLRNNFYNNVFGVGLMADNNNNNAANNLQNQPGFNNLTRNLRLLNYLFPNRPILNVRIINVRPSTIDVLRTAGIITGGPNVNQPSPPTADLPSVVRLETPDTSRIENGENSENIIPATASELANEQPSPPDPSLANDANVEPESSIKHQETCDDNVNNSVDVMKSSTSEDGESQTTSSNEQC